MGRKTVILRSQKGFALLEIFLDLAIVAVCLGVMTAYQYLAVKKSNIKIVERELAMLNAGAVSFAEHRSPKAYPPTTKTICVDFFLRERPQIVRRVLEDPLSKTKEEYHYARSPNGLYYCFWSVGDNSVSDTEGIDDNGNIIKNKASDDIYLTSLY